MIHERKNRKWYFFTEIKSQESQVLTNGRIPAISNYIHKIVLDASLKALISTLPKNISKDISTSQCVSLFFFFPFYILLTTNKNLLQNTIHHISFLSVYHSQTLSYPFTSPLTSRLLFSMLIYISGIFHLSGTKKSSNSSVCKCFIFSFPMYMRTQSVDNNKNKIYL